MQNSGSLDKISNSSISTGVAIFELRDPIFCRKVFLRLSASCTNVYTIEAVSLFISAAVSSPILSSYCFKADVTMPSFSRTRAKFLFIISKFCLLFELWESRKKERKLEFLTFFGCEMMWKLDVWVVNSWCILIVYALCRESFVKVKDIFVWFLLMGWLAPGITGACN